MLFMFALYKITFNNVDTLQYISTEQIMFMANRDCYTVYDTNCPGRVKIDSSYHSSN